MGEPAKKTKHKTEKPPLSAQEVRLASIYFNRGKKTVAECYLEAGFPPGATPHATEEAASARLKKPEVRLFYRKLQDRAADAAQIDANAVTQAAARIALFDIRKVFDDRGRIKLPHEWSDAVAAGVLSVETEELFEKQTETDPATGKSVRRKVLVGYARKVKRAPPTEAIKLLAQILRMIGQDAAPVNNETGITTKHADDL
jgi:hypothetical protein